MTLTGSVPLSATELYIGRSPWNGGTAYPLVPQDTGGDTMVNDAAPQTTQRVWRVELPTPAVTTVCADDVATCLAAATPATPLLLVRGQTTAEVWGPLQATWLPAASQPPDEVQRYLMWLPLAID
jgi:hypothetical protein